MDRIDNQGSHGELSRVRIASMLGRIRHATPANVMALSIVAYLCFVLPYGEQLAIVVGLRVTALLASAVAAKYVLAALDRGDDLLWPIRFLSLSLFWAGVTWGLLLAAIPIQDVESLGSAFLMLTVVTGLTLIVSAINPVSHILWSFMFGFTLSLGHFLYRIGEMYGVAPALSALSLLLAILICAVGLMRESRETGEIVLENRRLAEELGTLNLQLEETARENDRLAHHDLLSGIGNRRSFEEFAQTIEEQENRDRWNLLLIDLDHFKRVNDQAGHAAGDEVLRSTGSLLKEVAVALPGEAYAARLGGEEFGLLVEGLRDRAVADLNAAILQRFRLIAAPEGYFGQISASIGAARWGAKEKLDAVLRRADQALYRAKEEGRDRAVTAAAAPRNADQSSGVETMSGDSANGVMPNSG
ncbi:GGDEF domain-containing protein [Sphingomicrobium sediminis]|uniref:diguanylate cyclase n=1 Tax=Sphingomicrobium sediminis TaxID=2950949 RepID=A0A9X2J1M4_9SPHN|nr:GGDEF domain-containing protein [Sphingomicrobium sediminis]MCM8557423.1 GGDEF domain-containing protein [Sphingomicrobium sediminis]